MGDMKEQIASVPLFASMGKKELAALESAGKVLERPSGHEVTVEGEGGIGFFLVLEGTATVTVGGTEVRTLGPGDHLGEISLIDQGPRTATVTATSPIKLFALTAWNFKPLLDDPELQRQVLLGLCAIIRRQGQLL